MSTSKKFVLVVLLVMCVMCIVYLNWHQKKLDANRVTFQARKFFVVLHHTNGAVNTAIEDPDPWNLQRVVRWWFQLERIASILDYELQLQRKELESLQFFSSLRASLSYPHIFTYADKNVTVDKNELMNTLSTMKTLLTKYCNKFPHEFADLFDDEHNCRKTVIEALRCIEGDS